MSLSKDEQRALDEIERTFRDDDPKFAGNFAFARLERRQRIIGYAAFVFGVTVLLVGAMVTQVQTAAGVIVSLGGFLVMYVAACWIFRHHYHH